MNHFYECRPNDHPLPSKLHGGHNTQALLRNESKNSPNDCQNRADDDQNPVDNLLLPADLIAIDLEVEKEGKDDTDREA